MRTLILFTTLFAAASGSVAPIEYELEEARSAAMFYIAMALSKHEAAPAPAPAPAPKPDDNDSGSLPPGLIDGSAPPPFKRSDAKEIDRLVDANGKVLPQIYVFTATWCAPCQVLHKTIDRLQNAGWSVGENKTNRIRYIDADRNVDLISKYKIGTLPTIVVMKNGEEQQRFTGSECFSLDPFAIGKLVTE